MKHATIAIILAIVLLAVLILACGPGGEWSDWQRDVGDRQRQGLPTSMPVPTATPQVVASFAWEG